MLSWLKIKRVYLIWLLTLASMLFGQGVVCSADSLPLLLISDATSSENDLNATLTVSISQAASQSVRVRWTTVNGTARNATDFTSSSGELVFEPGAITQTLSVPLLQDAADEENELFYVVLSTPEGAAIGRGRGLVTIEDDDEAPTVSVTDTRLAEGQSGQRWALFYLRLSAPSGKRVQINYTTQNGAGEGAATTTDYVPVESATAAFNIGSSLALARVLINGDLRDEPDESLSIVLSQPLNATLGISTAAATILNDDRAPTVTISDSIVNEDAGFARFVIGLSAPSGKTIGVKWRTANGLATTPNDYNAKNGWLTFEPGRLSHTLDVPIAEDQLAENDETFYVLLSEPVSASIGRGRGQATIRGTSKIICPALTRIRVFPRSGYAAFLADGQIYGSNAGPNLQLQYLASISTPPREGQWHEINLAAPVKFRFLKFQSPLGSFGGLAELEFWSGNQRIEGTPLGSLSPPASPHTFDQAFDGHADTFFEGIQADDQWLALDLGTGIQAQPPAFSPAPGPYAVPVTISLASPTPNTTIRLTRGGESIYKGSGADPTREVGELYSAPFSLEKSSVLAAIAYTDDLAASAAAVGAYRIESTQGDPQFRVRTFHIGNSLTYGTDLWVQPLAESAAKPLDYHRFTIAGAAIQFLWEHPGSGFGDTNYPQALQVLAPFDHIFTQPYAARDKSIENEAEYARRFYDLARQNSPNIQPWLYSAWPDKSMVEPRTQGQGSAAPLNLLPPITWQDGVMNNTKFVESVRERINQNYAGKPVLIVPAGLGLATLKTEIEAGHVPGLGDYWTDIAAGTLHLSPKGNYYIALIFYACLFKESPEGKVGLLRSGLSPEQAVVLQRIAWQVARNYPYSGISSP